MAKLILLSCVLALLAIPIVAARARDARRGLQGALLLFVVYNFIYVFLIRFVYPRLL